MELSKQVCNLELSQKLKELGVKQESLFRWWDKFPIFSDVPLLWDKRQEKHFEDNTIFSGDAQNAMKKFSAFTVAELGEMLKEGAATSYYEGKWVCTYDTAYEVFKRVADTEADARAKMLCYLLEKNLINPNPLELAKS